MSNSLKALFAKTVAEAKDGDLLQVCLADAGMFGPGPVKRVVTPPGLPSLPNTPPSDDDPAGLYVIEVQVQTGPKAQVMTQPITFSDEHLRWFSTGPRRSDRPLVVPVGGGGLIAPRG